MHELQPDEVYHLGAQSHVRVSFDIPEYTGDVTGLGTTRLLEAIRETRPQGPLLPGFEQRDVRPGPGRAAARGHAVLSAQPLRRGQGLRLLDDGQLPRELRHARQQRHPLQPRIAPARRDLRHAQDHARAGADQGRPAEGALPRQPRRQARLGLRARVCRGDVAHAAAGQGRRLCRGHGRDPLGARISRGGVRLRRISTGRST